MSGSWYQDTQGIKENTVKSDCDFFNGVYMRPHQREAIDIVMRLDNCFKDKKIFFGPEIEMFYPVTSRFPPKG